MDTAQDIARTFFDKYSRALLDRDSAKIATLYAVPALVAFPQQSLPVSDPEQTRQFFEQSWAQYDGVQEAEPTVEVIASTAHSIWADVTWSYDGQPRERYVYQLLHDGDRWQVGVLTPIGQDD